MPRTTKTTTDTAQVAILTGDDQVQAQAQKAFHDIVIGRFTASERDVSDANTAHKQAQEAAGGVRRELLVALAKAAIKGKWTSSYAVLGITAAIEAYEKTALNGLRSNTLRQFASECGRAMHENTREHVEADFAAADKAWEAEDKRIADAKASALAAGKAFKRSDVETPLHDRFKRKYHMVVGSNGTLAARMSEDADRAALADDTKALAEAIGQDERTNSKRAARLIAKVVADLEAIAVEFPNDDWDVAIRFLSGINAESLAADRAYAERQRLREARNVGALRRTPRGDANRAGRVPAITAQTVADASDSLLGLRRR